jgi:hypothetical protein
MFSFMSILGGVAVYMIGANSSLVLGLTAVSGIKLQLLLPLLAAVCFLTPRKSWGKIAETNIKVKHIAFFGGVIGALGVFYLMRSGNFPIIPVSGAERHFRDALEELLGARPRFKEFFIGHPALIAAFYGQKIGYKSKALLLIGFIGQISIVNTFMHFHIPLELCLLRTIHGIWIGSLLSIPLCWVVHQLSKEKTW